MEGDKIDIYDNLLNVDLSEEVDKLHQQNNQLLDHIKSLETDIEKLCAQISEMKKTQDNLSKNISELFKTAKTEIERKDRIISDLRAELDRFKCMKKSSFSLKRERGPSPSVHKFFEEPAAKKIRTERDENYKKEKRPRSRSRSRDRSKHSHKEKIRDENRKDHKSDHYDKHNRDTHKKHFISESHHKRQHSNKMNSESTEKRKEDKDTKSTENEKVINDEQSTVNKKLCDRQEKKLEENNNKTLIVRIDKPPGFGLGAKVEMMTKNNENQAKETKKEESQKTVKDLNDVEEKNKDNKEEKKTEESAKRNITEKNDKNCAFDVNVIKSKNKTNNPKIEEKTESELKVPDKVEMGLKKNDNQIKETKIEENNKNTDEKNRDNKQENKVEENFNKDLNEKRDKNGVFGVDVIKSKCKTNKPKIGEKSESELKVADDVEMQTESHREETKKENCNNTQSAEEQKNNLNEIKKNFTANVNKNVEVKKLKIKANKPKIEDVTIKLKQKLGGEARNSDFNVVSCVINDLNISNESIDEKTDVLNKPATLEIIDKTVITKEVNNTQTDKKEIEDSNKNDLVLKTNNCENIVDLTLDETDKEELPKDKKSECKKITEKPKIVAASKKIKDSVSKKEKKYSSNKKEKVSETPKDTVPKKEIKEKRLSGGKKEKTEEIPESSRILRSAAKKKSSEENQIQEKSPTKSLTPTNLFDCSVNLTHEGEIPTLHISDPENPQNDMILNKEQCTSTTTSTPIRPTALEMQFLEDLNLSLGENKVTEANKNSTEIDSSNNELNTLSEQKTPNTSSAKKRRRVVVTMID
ncbi:putative leucine-rich repeat-containing protein DDB_G0290503 [Tribolium madens]|uniref:putative leucine-rich repeat-containing protein DDB_G0290503 n=1 Tax=Tribolium madens TaxID=41895 RepID=UPI001CF726F9|nr:putative leucine-rich repeat-containing protein DDB_G0290503 [Tribolium madens]